IRQIDHDALLDLDVLSSESPLGRLEALGPPTWAALRDQLKRRSYHLLVFLGHGDVAKQVTATASPGGYLVLERSQNRAKDKVASDRFSRTATSAKRPTRNGAKDRVYSEKSAPI